VDCNFARDCAGGQQASADCHRAGDFARPLDPLLHARLPQQGFPRLWVCDRARL